MPAEQHDRHATALAQMETVLTLYFSQRDYYLCGAYVSHVFAAHRELIESFAGAVCALRVRIFNLALHDIDDDRARVLTRACLRRKWSQSD